MTGCLPLALQCKRRYSCGCFYGGRMPVSRSPGVLGVGVWLSIGQMIVVYLLGSQNTGGRNRRPMRFTSTRVCHRATTA